MAIYSHTVTSGQGGHGHHSKLNITYLHKFQRHAYSLTVGPFGGVKGKDYIAILSLDGCITVYEQESYAFYSFLPGFLLPGPMAYVAKSDGFVTVSSDWSLQCYKYQALASAADKEKANPNISKGKRLSPEWSRQLGEEALEILVISPPEGPTNILVLTVHNMYCFKESGVPRFVKKLEYNPSTFLAFPVENAIHICIGTHTSTLLVYRETELKWASQLPFVPIALARADFTARRFLRVRDHAFVIYIASFRLMFLFGIKGALVSLGDTGQLQVSYLGTDPSLFVAPPTETREINYDQTDRELNQLHKVIKASTKDTGAVVGMTRGDSDLIVSATVGTQLERWVGETRVQDPEGVPAVPVVLRLTAHIPLNCVRVHICTEKPLAVTQDTFMLRTICDTSQIMVKIYLVDPYIPTSLKLNIVASYITHTGAPRIISSQLELPLRIVVKPCTPSKEADHKITVTTNKPAVNLPELFPDFGLDGSVTTALGLQYYNGTEVTLLSSRTTNRYRLQSDSLSALWIILKEVLARLKGYWSNSSRKNGEELELGVASAIPVHELLTEIDAHFMRRKKHQELQAQLVQRATQFRAVQRRLLTKFKDKTPTPLTNLDNLLEGTYKQILQITDVINDNARGLEEDGCMLSCTVQLILELVRLQIGMTDQEFALLSAAISPVIYSNMDQGWEEVTDASVTFLLRAILGRGSRDAVSTPELTVPMDTVKLKKHLGLFLDKILKGGVNLTLEASSKPDDADTHEDVHSEDEEELEESPVIGKIAHPVTADDPTTVPMGSRLGEDRARSARLRSARLQSARNRLGQSTENYEINNFAGYKPEPAKMEESDAMPNNGDDSEGPININALIYQNSSSDETSSILHNEEKDTPDMIGNGLPDVDESELADNEESEIPDMERNESLDMDENGMPDMEENEVTQTEESIAGSDENENPGLNKIANSELEDNQSTDVNDKTKNSSDQEALFNKLPSNKNLEALKKQTSKDNLIESPSNIFSADDGEDIW
ncbi:Protein PTHB1 [Halocaridina rubra]|uniref:Protein PTHB1 n=1 Tax=Halocaridina rubra TaxID=373956 RepID=A0AAN8WG95_HALRR